MNLAALIAVSASCCWGIADFLGGWASRREHVLRVLVQAQIIGLAVAIAVFAPLLGAPDSEWIAWGAVAGIFGGLGIIAFYEALRIAPMGLVAPVSSCSVLIPVAVSLARGERPGLVAAAGLVAVIVGIVLVGIEPLDESDRLRFTPQALWLSLATAAGFGTALSILDAASGASSTGLEQPLWASVGLRVGSLVVIGLACLATRTPLLPLSRGIAWPLVGIGVFEVAANALFAVAANRGQLAIAAVLGSLYPIITALLARIVLHERIVRHQLVGAAIVLSGVALVSASG